MIWWCGCYAAMAMHANVLRTDVGGSGCKYPQGPKIPLAPADVYQILRWVSSQTVWDVQSVKLESWLGGR